MNKKLLVLGFVLIVATSCEEGSVVSTPSDSNPSAAAKSISPVKRFSADGTTATCLPGTSICTIPGGTLINAGQCAVLGDSELCMQTQGNLVLYPSSGAASWDTQLLTDFDAAGYSGTTADLGNCTQCFAAFQTDGNLVLYNPAFNGNIFHAYWASNTGGNSGAVLEISPNNPTPLSIVESTGIVLWSPIPGYGTYPGPFVGCQDNTFAFIREHIGNFVDNTDAALQTTALTIGSSGSLSLQEIRQVGGSPMIPSIPYDTDCSILEQGVILGVYANAPGCNYLAGYDPTDQMLFYQINHATINNVYSDGASATVCQPFADTVNSNAMFQEYLIPIRSIDSSSFQFMDDGTGSNAGETMIQSTQVD